MQQVILFTQDTNVFSTDFNNGSNYCVQYLLKTVWEWSIIIVDCIWRCVQDICRFSGIGLDCLGYAHENTRTSNILFKRILQIIADYLKWLKNDFDWLHMKIKYFTSS